jgi:mono/diheme cytochrome c family protein
MSNGARKVGLWRMERKMSKHHLLISGSLAAAALAFLISVGACASSREESPRARNDQTQPPAVLMADDRTTAVKDVYAKYCLACHGHDGKGTDMKKAMPNLPDFTSRKWQDEVSNVQIKVSILDGKGTLMPPFRDKLSDDDNSGLTAYIRDFAPKQ